VVTIGDQPERAVHDGTGNCGSGQHLGFGSRYSGPEDYVAHQNGWTRIYEVGGGGCVRVVALGVESRAGR
jgi:hypothetical protein